MSDRLVRCSKCGHTDTEDAFPKGYDFFQNPYIRKCPMDCGNMQLPGPASMRMFSGDRPFTYVSRPTAEGTALGIVLHRADEAS